MSEFTTVFGSLNDYEKGRIEIIDDDPKAYAFSNMYDVASRSAPYEKVVVAKNLEYVIEILRAEGASPWFTASHDEYCLIMDGNVDIELVKLDQPEAIAPPEKEGSVMLNGNPEGRKMGHMKLRRGHQALLPKGAAYRYSADKAGVILMQTIQGDHSVEKWADICYR